MNLIAWLVRWLVHAFDLDPRELWPDTLDPITKVVELRDDAGLVYAWILGEEATDQDLQDWAAEINSIYINHYGHVPRAAHVTVRTVKDIRRLPQSEQETLLKPWMHEKQPL